MDAQQTLRASAPVACRPFVLLHCTAVDCDMNQAGVTFGDARVNADPLKHATAHAGHPSSIKGGGKCVP
jgi:hypothetical protein